MKGLSTITERSAVHSGSVLSYLIRQKDVFSLLRVLISCQLDISVRIKREVLESDVASVPICVIFGQQDFQRLQINGGLGSVEYKFHFYTDHYNVLTESPLSMI